MQTVRRWSWAVLLTWTVLAAVVYAAVPVPALRSSLLAVTAVISVAATFGGIALHRPRAQRAWCLTALTQVLFLVGSLLRPWSVGQSGAGQLLGDAFTLAGYAACIAGLTSLLRSRGPLERFALADGLTASLGALALALVLFALPAAEIPGRPPVVSLIAGLYPVLDVVVLLVLANFGFTTAGRLPSYRALCGSVLAIVVGDLGYAWIGAEGRLTGSALLDLPFVVAFGLYGVNALHPSMTRLGSPAQKVTQDWSWRRLALLVPGVAAPSLAVVVLPDVSAVDRLILGGTTLVTVGMLVARAISAVRGHVRARRNLVERAARDPLTGLLSRAGLSDGVEDLLATGHLDKPIWAIALDLDNFRFVNDSWGHGTGDELLREIGRRLSCAAPAGSLLARTGGDEFVLVTSGTPAQVTALAQGLRSAVRAPAAVDGAEFVVTVSVGLARAGRRGMAIELLRDADTAMSAAKAEGRDRLVRFDEQMRQRVRDRLEIELALRYGLDRGQFWVAYQPLVDMRGEVVVGCEALLRWRHPGRGSISPAEFIPVAEETGLINDLGTWVIETSVEQAARWRADGVVAPDFVVSVNVSPRQLADGGVLGVVARALQRTGLPPANLVLEITESVMLERPEQTLEVLDRLRDLGVGLSLDDFGTGYSSLSHLSRLPVTTIKLDRSFVERLDEGGDATVVRAVQAISTAMSLGVVAEGIETEGQRDVLRELGVPVGQGWLWGAAVGAEEFRARWARGDAPVPAVPASASAPATSSAQAAVGAGTSYAQ